MDFKVNNLRWGLLSPSVRQKIALIPQTSLAVRVAGRLSGHHLRILAFHDVPDRGRFDALIREITLQYQPVSGDDVAASLRGESGLPADSVWFTFDDGLQSTFRAGDLLAAQGVSATAFVCPGSIGRRGWQWFDAVAAAKSQGLVDIREEGMFDLARMKAIRDDERRALVATLERRLAHAGHSPPPSLTVDDLGLWRSQGHTVGNHTWDHPCLDTCTKDAQRQQILKAHKALVAWGIRPDFFAYPNGNWAADAADVLRELGYSGSLLFDHRLAKDVSDVHRISRLRIDSDIDPRRAMSILSGAHSFAYQLVAG